jgi:hypothetical protein
MDNLRGILWMVAAMAGFALEDAFVKLASGALSLGPIVADLRRGRFPVLHSPDTRPRAAARDARHALVAQSSRAPSSR